MSTELTVLARERADLIAGELARDPRLRSPASRRGYVADLAAFYAWLGDRVLTRLLVDEYAALLQAEERSPNSINRRLAAIRWWARRLAELAAEDPTLAMEQRDQVVREGARVGKVRNVKGERAKKGRHVADDEVRALLKACAKDRSPASRRDAALLALAWSTGARRAEIAALCLDELKGKEGTYDVTLRGKGDKVRTAYLAGDAAAFLAKWLARRGTRAGFVFCPVRKNAHLALGQGLSTEALARILAKRVGQAGIAALTWHDLRRTFAGNLLDAGTDLSTVQQLMGHASPTTTAAYDRRGERTRRQAALQLKLPL